MPGSNLEYWRPKLQRNVQRDAEKDAELRELGWRVLVVWECEISMQSSISDVVDAVSATLTHTLRAE
jgi:DNA mismatch endonuclease (patch repair protein)